MKKIALLLSVFIASFSSSAATINKAVKTSDATIDVLPTIKRPQVKTAEQPQRLSFDQQRKQILASISKQIKSHDTVCLQPNSAVKWLSANELMSINKSNGSSKLFLDSIICKDSATNKNVSKQIFTYNEHKFPTLSSNYIWDFIEKKWKYYGEYGYLWDDLGRCLSKWNKADVKSSFKYDYSYNDAGYLLSRISYVIDNDDWAPNTKNTYVVNDKGSVEEEKDYTWDATNSDWVLKVTYTATYDEKNRITSYGDLEETGSKKELYDYDDKDRIIRKDILFLDSLNNWTNFKRNNLVYDGDLLKHEDLFYWNPVINTWDGGETIDGIIGYNCLIDYFYDEQGRDTLENYYNRFTSEGDYTKTVEYKYDYSILSNGYTQRVWTNSEFDMVKGKLTRIPYYQITDRYTPWHTIDYHFECAGENYSPTVEDTMMYDSKQRQTDGKYYVYDTSGTRLGSAWEHFNYDELNNISDHILYEGVTGTDDQWDPLYHWILTYEQDTICTGTTIYKWNSKIEDWQRNMAVFYTFDFSLPFSDVIMWNGLGLNIKHKLDKSREFYNNNTLIYVYNYGEPAIDGIATINSQNDNINIYPLVTRDNINIDADGSVDARLFNASGTMLIHTTNKIINVSSLPHGLYILKVNGVTKKIIKQ
jgi:hypothetical protein